jgi:hypothetical protein
MGDLPYTATCSEHGKQDAVLVPLKSKILFQPRYIGICESTAIEVVEEVCSAAIHLVYCQLPLCVMACSPNQYEAICC